jgi:hypothetical protein
MCDYSLMSLPNRLAREGERLLVHRFPSGSIGLASPADCAACAPQRAGLRGVWTAVRDFFSLTQKFPIPAVCIPPGAQLRLSGMSDKFRSQHGIADAEEVVTFDQRTQTVNAYRDAIRFPDGRSILLQELKEGQWVTVLHLDGLETERTDETLAGRFA